MKIESLERFQLTNETIERNVFGSDHLLADDHPCGSLSHFLYLPKLSLEATST